MHASSSTVPKTRPIVPPSGDEPLRQPAWHLRRVQGSAYQGDPDFGPWLPVWISHALARWRQPLVRWLAAPIVGVPTVYGGYSTMLSFWQGIGVSPSLWLHALAIVAGVTSGVAAIARLRS